MADSVHNIYWKNSWNLSSQYTMSGYSRAAENTGFYCKELDAAFDAGVQTNEKPAYIFLTHLHNDHMCALNKMLISNVKNPIIFIPNNDKFELLLIQTLKMIYLSSKFIHPESNKGLDPKSTYSYRIVKLNVGESYEFKKSTSIGYYVEGLPSNHGVESISFGIYESRRRCKPEYQNLDPKIYIKLKSDGVDFLETYKYPILCYMSDTSHHPFIIPIQSQMIFSYPIIFIECTFLESEDLPLAKKKNHMHWLQIQPHIIANPEIKFVLTHFSKRYTWIFIKKFFNDINKLTPISNIIIWLQTGIIDYGMQKIEKNIIEV